MSTDSAEVMHPLHAKQSVSDISARWSFSFCFCGSCDICASSLAMVEALEVGGGGGFGEVDTS